MATHDLEDRVGKLESALSDFSQELQYALRYIQSDAASSLTKSRAVLEKLLLKSYVFEMEKEHRKSFPTLGDILVDNQFTKKIERRIVSRMNAIRDMGNLGPHGEVVEPNDAARVLDDLCEVIEWYLQRYPAEAKTPTIGSKTKEVASPTGLRRVFTLGPHGSFGMLSWTTDRGRAKRKWDEFWAEHVASSKDRTSMKAEDYSRRYAEIVGADRFGPEASPEVRRPRDLNVRGFFMPGGSYEAMQGINTSKFTGFEDDGVAFKDIDTKYLKDYCPPLSETRKF